MKAKLVFVNKVARRVLVDGFELPGVLDFRVIYRPNEVGEVVVTLLAENIEFVYETEPLGRGA